MAKLTSRDYKSTQRRPPDFRRLREFGYGVLVGIVLASAAFVYLGGTPRRTRDTADAPRPDPYRAAPADAGSGGVGPGRTAEKYDFYQMLPNFEVVVPERTRTSSAICRRRRRSNVPGYTSCRRARTATKPTPIACARSLHCRGSTPGCSASRWTQMSGIGCVSGRSAIWTSSTRCAGSCGPPRSMRWLSGWETEEQTHETRRDSRIRRVRDSGRTGAGRQTLGSLDPAAVRGHA